MELGFALKASPLLHSGPSSSLEIIDMSTPDVHVKTTFETLSKYLAKLFLWTVATVIVPTIGVIVGLNYSILYDLHRMAVDNERNIEVVRTETVAHKELDRITVDRLNFIEQQLNAIAAAIITTKETKR